MPNKGDSSVLRSLAVAFADGLAFGAGMKLTQQRPGSAPAAVGNTPPEIDPLLERLRHLEQRMTLAEQTRVMLPTVAASTGPAPAPFDQKVLEAVVTALDARLQEQSGRVESRITEMQAKLAIELKSLSQQDHSIATGIQANLEETNLRLNDQMAELRRHADEDRLAVRSEIASLHREFAVEVARAVEDRVEEVVTKHSTVLRAEIEYRDHEIAELREVLVGIARACSGLSERPAPRPQVEAEPEPLSNVQVLPDRRAG